MLHKLIQEKFPDKFIEYDDLSFDGSNLRNKSYDSGFLKRREDVYSNQLEEFNEIQEKIDSKINLMENSKSTTDKEILWSEILGIHIWKSRLISKDN